MHRSIFIALAALAAGTAVAEEVRQLDPTDPRAKVPGVEYRSAFDGFRPLAEDKVAPWRESNEAVKEGAEPEGHAPQSSPKPKPAAKPRAGPEHGGHR